jgi:hypothetical protein
MTHEESSGKRNALEYHATRSRRRLGALGLLVTALLAPGTALAVKPAEVFVTAQTSFSIDPPLGWGQYFGTIHYTKVEVVRPLDATLTKKVIKKARRACLRLFANGDGVVFPAFIIYDDLSFTPDQGGIRRLSAQLDPFVIDSDGNWTSKGFNSNDPAKLVRAQGGFWTDTYYNFRELERPTSFRVGKNTIQADCDGDVSAEADYPG